MGDKAPVPVRNPPKMGLMFETDSKITSIIVNDRLYVFDNGGVMVPAGAPYVLDLETGQLQEFKPRPEPAQPATGKAAALRRRFR